MHILNANEILITFSSDWKLEMPLMQTLGQRKSLSLYYSAYTVYMIV